MNLFKKSLSLLIAFAMINGSMGFSLVNATDPLTPEQQLKQLETQLQERGFHFANEFGSDDEYNLAILDAQRLIAGLNVRLARVSEKIGRSITEAQALQEARVLAKNVVIDRIPTDTEYGKRWKSEMETYFNLKFRDASFDDIQREFLKIEGQLPSGGLVFIGGPIFSGVVISLMVIMLGYAVYVHLYGDEAYNKD